MLHRTHPPRLLSWLLLFALTSLVFLPMMLHWHNTGDFEVHTQYVIRIMNGEPGVLNTIPNFIYHLMVIVVYLVVPPFTIPDAVIAVSLLLYLFLAGVIFWLVRHYLKPRHARQDLTAILLTLVLLLVAPVILFTPENMYFGYLVPYVYHNPTMLPLRPFSLLLFIAAAGIFRRRSPVNSDALIQPGTLIWLLLVAGLTIASILSKPSFVMILLPALAVLTVVNLVRRNPIDWQTLILGIVLPGGLLLAYQGLTTTRGSLAWSPLYVFDLWALHYNPEANQQLAVKFLLSIVFPLAVYAVYLPQARRNVVFNLAWLCFLAGAAYTYLLIDLAEPPAGNLTWNGQIGIFILMIAAALVWIKQDRRTLRFWLCAAMLALHAISGIIWYMIHLLAAWPQLIYTYW